MKKYFIAVAALALLAACSGKKTTEPALIEEESVTVANRYLMHRLCLK